MVKLMRNHGLVNRSLVKRFGHVSRMDSIQAAILNFRIKKLRNVIQKRRKNVKLYKKHLDYKNLYIPKETDKEFNTYHTFVVQTSKRDLLKKYLKYKGIETAIHYPIPIHKQPAYKRLKIGNKKFINSERQAKKILTLPINQSLKKKHIIYISKTINEFFHDHRN